MNITKVTFHRFKKYRDTVIAVRPGISLLAGGNNSGKSTVLQGIAIWEFCKTVLKTERGVQSLYSEHAGQGVGINSEDFTPVNIPTLKHLWTNLKPQKEDEQHGYTLTVSVDWRLEAEEEDHHLTLGLSLVNDRLFIKALESTLNENTPIPNIAYIPPFAGIDPKEPKYTPAIIRRHIGQGLPGAVLRNVLLDLYRDNSYKREKERKEKGSNKLSSSFLKSLRKTDPFERLLQLLQDVFSYGLKIKEFNEIYHTKITIESFRGEVRNNRFLRILTYNPRDIMVEGSGFLQWLTVVSLSLSPGVNVILLDEPDAHLHTSLQKSLLDHLVVISKHFSKQILYSTHSSELIKSHNHLMIIDTNRGNPKYLSLPEQKITILSGIGSRYTPRLAAAEEKQKILFVENESDANFLNIFAQTLSQAFENDIVVWPWPSGHKERRYFFLEMKKMLPNLKAISLVDRDMEAVNSVTNALMDKSYPDPNNGDAGWGFYARKWRRRHIENYLLHPDSIARAANVEPQVIIDHIVQNFALDISGRVIDQNEPEAILQCNAKDIVELNTNSLKNIFNISKFDIAKSTIVGEICQDVHLIINDILSLNQQDAQQIKD